MAGLDDFEPDFRMDAQGMSLASPENKAQWTLAHHVEFQKRQGIWAEFAKSNCEHSEIQRKHSSVLPIIMVLNILRLLRPDG